MTKDLKNISIVFMGTSEFASISLAALLKEGYDISAVYTQPGKKVGRSQEMSKSPVGSVAEKNNIPIIEPKKFTEEIVSQLKETNPDLIIVAAYGKILPSSVLKIPRLGCINIHGSLLPKFRGPSPIQNVLLNGEVETGTTLIVMNEGIDTGDIIAQSKLKIGLRETFPELFERLSADGANLLLATLPRWIKGEIKVKVQDNSAATLCQLIEREDGRIIWTDDAMDIYNRYRAFFSWPGIYTFWERGGKLVRLKLVKISLLEIKLETEKHLGEVFEIDDKVGVMTTLGVIFLEEVQLEGKKSLSIGEFLNGYPDFLGSILK